MPKPTSENFWKNIIKRKSNKRFLTSALLAFIFVGGAFVSSLWAAGPSQRFVLDNGLVVLISEMPTSPMVSVYGLVRTGSAREGEFVGSGISHFLEHMLFQGAHGQPGGALAAKVQAVGGNINASTGQDFTIYTVNVPNDHFEMALDTLTGMLFNAPIDPQEVEKERDVIFAEMRLHKDNPDSWLGRLAFQNSYLKHTYRHPVIGYEDLFGRITREELWQYYKQHYAPNNIILSVAGNIKTEEIKGKIIEKLNSIPRQPFVLDIVPQEPPQISARRFEEEYPTDLARLSMAFQGVSLLNEDMYALDVLAVVMGQGESSRLYQKLYKEKGIAYSVYASNYTPVDPGLFEVEALCEAARGLGEICVAAHNAPNNFVCSGATRAVERVEAMARARGALRVNRLATSHAFHSPLMSAAAPAWRTYLAGMDFEDSGVPVALNTTGELSCDRASIHRAAADQLDRPIRWVSCVQAMLDAGARVFIEAGESKVLSAFIRACSPEATAISMGADHGLRRIEALSGVGG